MSLRVYWTCLVVSWAVGQAVRAKSSLGLDPLTTCVSCAHSGGEAGAARSHAQLRGRWR